MRVQPAAFGQRFGSHGVERCLGDDVVVERDAQRVLVDERAPGDVIVSTTLTGGNSLPIATA